MSIQRFVAMIGLAASSSWAAGTTTWEMTTWQDFLRGRLANVSLSRDGQLRPAAPWKVAFEDGQSSVWSAVEAPDGTLYLGTGHKGRVIRISPQGQATTIFTAPEPQVFALALDAQGVLYAGTSPEGKIYRIENGRGTEYFDPKERYIWSLAPGAKPGTLYAGTGERGKVFRITGAGQGELYFDSGQSHITALTLDADQTLLAGSDPNGILYRIRAKDTAFVLYDAPLPEIRSIVRGPEGRLYIGALGGSVAKRAGATGANGASSGLTVVTAPMTITVEAQAGMELKPKSETPKPAAAQASPTPAPQIEISGVEKSAIYRLNADNTVETLWSSKDENAYDLLLTGGSLTFSTDGTGRVYSVGDDRKVTLLDQTNRGDLVRLVKLRSGLAAISSTPGLVLTQGEGAVSATPASYESPVHDAGSVARWGRLEWHGAGPLKFWIRSGNSARPDKTWSEWSAVLSAPGMAATPNARYVQWKSELGPASEIDTVSLAYRPQNNAPTVKNISVVSQLATTGPAAKPQATPAGGAYSITVTDTGDSGASSLSGTATQNAGRAGARQLVVSWTAEDIDNDNLSFTLSFRGEDETLWKTLRTAFAETTFTIDGDALADGRYFFRVIASDRSSNTPTDAREGDLVSAPVRIDNTPPLVTVAREGDDIVVKAADGTSALRRCEYSVNAGPWVLAEAEDGVTDSREETFRLRLNGFKTGENLLTVRVTDAAGNPGLAKLVLR